MLQEFESKAFEKELKQSKVKQTENKQTRKNTFPREKKLAVKYC